MSLGKEFQADGPATENERSPILVAVRGTWLQHPRNEAKHIMCCGVICTPHIHKTAKTQAHRQAASS